MASLALQSVIDDAGEPEGLRENSLVISVPDGEPAISDPAAQALGLSTSLLKGNRGSFAAPHQPDTFVAYSQISGTSSYYVTWYEDTVIEDIVRQTVNVAGILKWIEIAYDIPAVFVSGDPESGEAPEILYRNTRYFENCESLQDLGLTPDDLAKNDAKASGKLTYDGASFIYASGASEAPAGYVIMLEPVPNLYAKVFVQGGYMIAALMILVIMLLVTGFSLYPYVRNNILTPEEEKKYTPSRARSTASLFGFFGLVIIAVLGMFSYALNGMYDDVVRGRTRLGMLNDSLDMFTERYSDNMRSFQDVYLEYGNQIAGLLDTYPQLRDAEVLATLADSISASAITLYDADGRETVSSGRWTGLALSADPGSTTYDFRRILRGVPNVVHGLETDEVTGLNEMRLGIRIEDGAPGGDTYGVMMLCVDIPALTNYDIDPEKTVREIFAGFTDPETTFLIADSVSGQILVSSDKGLEGNQISALGLADTELKGSLVKTLKTEEGDYFVTSESMETPEILAWTGASDCVISYYRGPKTTFFLEMIILAAVGSILFLIIYSLLSWRTLSGYTDAFFNAYKNEKGAEDPKNKMGPIRRTIAAATPPQNGMAAMEIAMGVIMLVLICVMNINSAVTKNTVYRYVIADEWERGFNLFAIAAILILMSKIVLLVIGLRILMTVLAYFSASKGKTIFRLLANVFLYTALFVSLIKIFEYLGFSPAAIAAGMGSLALAISLGAQNFVSDIIAGLTFVFEGTVHAGDNVEIAAYGSPDLSGRVVEVGVRCIKLLTKEGDVITCSNRDVKMIKNSTQLNSKVICEIEVSSEIAADDLRQILEAELPAIGETDRRILGGPIYNGITAYGGGKMTLSVSAECSEDDYSYVRDRLYVSLQKIFREHGCDI